MDSQNDLQSRKKRLRWLQQIPPVFSLMLVVAFGIIFYKIVQEFDLSAVRFSRILSILTPFIIGLVIAFFLSPPVKALEKLLLRLSFLQRHPRITALLSLVISYVTILGLLVLVLVYIVPQIFSGLSTLILLLIDSVQYLYRNLGRLITYWDESSWSSLISGQDLYQFLSSQLSSLTINLQNIASTVLPMVYQTVAGVASGSINTLVGIIISIYLVGDRDNVSYGGKRILYALFKKERANHILELAHEALGIFRRFFVGKALDSLIIGILCYILMRIFRLPYAELISVIVGITNIIPYFGPFIGAIPSILIILMVSPLDALIFAIMILVLQQVDGNIIGPAILGNSLGLKPIWIIFSVTVGGGFFGIIGMIAGVPAFTVLHTWAHRFVERRLARKNMNQPEQIQAADLQRQNARAQSSESEPEAAEAAPADSDDSKKDI